MSKWQLFTALVTGQPTDLHSDQRLLLDRGWVLGIEREDGSGCCWNVTYRPDDGRAKRTLFLRTVD